MFLYIYIIYIYICVYIYIYYLYICIFSALSFAVSLYRSVCDGIRHDSFILDT